MNKNAALSVIMANYNYGHWVGEALESILNQSHRPMEVIVVDDGSTDNSVAVIEKFAKKHPNLRLLKNEKNMGAFYSINRAFKETSGEYIYWPAADDKVLPGLFEKAINMLLQNPKAGLCCSDYLMFKDGNRRYERRLRLSKGPRYFSPEEVADLFRKKRFNPIVANTTIVKRSAFNKAGGYIDDIGFSADYFIHHTIALRNGICYIPEILSAIRVHTSQFGGPKARKKDMEIKVIKRMLDTIKKPDYRDILPLFKRAAFLTNYPNRWEVLNVILKNREHRDLLSFKLLRFTVLDRTLNWILIGLLITIATLFDIFIIMSIPNIPRVLSAALFILIFALMAGAYTAMNTIIRKRDP